MSDNVIDLSEKKDGTEEGQPTPQEQARVVLQKIDTDRKEGIDRLDRACKQLGEIGHLAEDPKLEERLREVEAGIRSTCTALQAANALTDILIQDFMNLAGVTEKTQEMTSYQGLHYQTLTQTLLDKGVITQEELAINWKNTLKAAGVPEPTDSSQSTE